MNSLYGRYRTVTFSNIWSDEATFRSELMNSKLYNSNFTQSSITKLYYLLYAEYGNSHIASSDPNQFKYKLYAIVFNEGMKWQKSLEIQDKLEKLNESEIKEATRSVRTFGYNPGEGGIRLDESGDATLNYINEQNSSKYLQGNIQAYTNYLSSLKDVTTSFINKFQKLFLTVVQPERPLLYGMEDFSNDDEWDI